MDTLAMAGPGLALAPAMTSPGLGFTELVLYAIIGFALTGIATTCWHCLMECKKWRRSSGRSVFWPLIH